MKDLNQKYYTEEGLECEPTLSVGDMIEFELSGHKYRGRITVIGKHGYWISNSIGAVGSGSIRCSFGKERKIELNK